MHLLSLEWLASSDTTTSDTRGSGRPCRTISPAISEVQKGGLSALNQHIIDRDIKLMTTNE